MAGPTVYGDGSLYGDADAFYGRTSAALIAAQIQSVRETGLRVSIVNERINNWEHWVGTHSMPDVGLGWGLYRGANGNTKIYELEYYSYRGLADAAVKSNGDIVMVRVGSPADGNDRQIWSQTITDPTTLGQWNNWAVLYSGTHYSASVEIADDGSTVLVYHSKSDGLYRNNTKVVDNSEFATSTSKALVFSHIEGGPQDMGFITCIAQDAVSTSSRRVEFYFIDDVTTDAPSYLPLLNNDWFRGSVFGAYVDGIIHGYMGNPIHYSPRSVVNGHELAHFTLDPTTLDQSALYPIRGVGGGAGINYLAGASITQLSDNYYYIFAQEIHQISSGNISATSNLGSGFPVWIRSKDLVHWSEPVIGPALSRAWGLISPVETDGYLYFGDHEEIWRRPTTGVTYDISNYVPEVEFELPRDNQPASGQVLVANPAGINDVIRSLSGREIIIEPGLKVADGTYEYSKHDRFFIGQVNRVVEGEANRLQVGIGNVWTRLENPFRDILNFIGQFTWDDFSEGKRNQPFNYFFVTDTGPRVSSDGKLTTRGIVLLTAWKGSNFDIRTKFAAVSGVPRVIGRYIDADNYLYVKLESTTLALFKRVDGNDTQLDTWTVTADANPRFRWRMIFGRYDVWLNDTYIGGGTLTPIGHPREPGYVGFSATTAYTIDGLHVEDWEVPLTFEDLMRIALASGDFHDASIGGADDRAVAITWGPQTDLSTPAAALETLLETTKTQLIWRNGQVEIGRFNDTSSMKTIENTVIDSTEVDESKRRVNLVSIDGNEHYWLEVDADDMSTRDALISAYFDLPELLDQDAVIARAREEMKRAAQGSSPGGTTPLYFDLWRMDAVDWVDNEGNSQLVRIEGYSVNINQSKTPSQRQTFDTSLFSPESSSALMEDPPPDAE